MRPRDWLATVVACACVLAACGGRDERTEDPPLTCEDGACTVQRAEGHAQSADAGRDALPHGEWQPQSTNTRTCSDGYVTSSCRRPGLSVDVFMATPCCGSTTSIATCCAAKGQPCANELGETCCAGLTCGSRCICE